MFWVSQEFSGILCKFPGLGTPGIVRRFSLGTPGILREVGRSKHSQGSLWRSSGVGHSKDSKTCLWFFSEVGHSGFSEDSLLGFSGDSLGILWGGAGPLQGF